MSSSKTPLNVTPLSPDESAALLAIADKASESFIGQFQELETAIGMLVIGRLIGWRVLVLVHNKRTIRKYEEILGINIKEAFPATGPLTSKSVGYKVAERLGNYWKAVSGDVKVEGRNEIA